MATGKISKSSVNKLRPGEKDEFLWDEDLRGFGAKVTPAGRIVYLVQYRIGGRKSPTRRVTLGEHGKLTPAEARTEARKVLGKAALMEDVAETRAKLRRQGTVSDVADRYLKEHVARHNKPSTQAEAERIVEKRIRPNLGKLKIQALTRAKAKEWHQEMRDSPYEANRALAYLSKMMSLAADEWELIPNNPCRGLKRFPEKKRERFLTEEELAELGKALARCEKRGDVPETFSGALKLLSITGCRMSEILNLRWEDVDSDFSALRLADAKTGPRVVPLAGAAQKILKKLKRTDGWVFPAVKRDMPMSRHAFHHYWARVRDESAIPNIRPHDLRHTAGTYAAQAGFNAFHVRDFLGHRSLAMSSRYVERSADPIRATADSVGARIANALEGKHAGRVVALKKPRKSAGKKR